MRLRDKFRLLAGSFLLVLIAAFALAASGTPSTAAPALSQASFESNLGEHALTCFERHHPCSPSGAAPAPAAPVALDAMPAAGLVKAPALLPAPMRDVAPHAAASLSILFRNFRE